jgi:beta-lactamase regulating signal transducer with metallopeptidase domain
MNAPLWLSNLVFWSGQVAVLVAVAAFLPRLLRIRQPRVLLAFWRALLVISLALPFLQPWHRLPAIPVANLPTDSSASISTPAPLSAASHWQLPSLQTIAPVIAFVILAGIAFRLVILIIGLLKLRQFRRVSTPLPPDCESAALVEQLRSQLNVTADFRRSADVDSPVTFGLRAPIILLPASFLTLGSQFQLAIACHELLHVRRRDWSHHLLEEAIRAVAWFHPAIAWLIARVRLAREQVVDQEVVALTNARKTYLEALLEFTAARLSASAVLAPPFLIERQLGERVALMLKEVRMSRPRLVASLTAISCCVLFAIVLGVWAFPLKGVPLVTQDKPTGGVAGGVSGGAAGGVDGGVSGGIDGQPEASVDRNSIWTDTVKRGSMPLQVHGEGTILRAQNPQNLIARILVPASLTAGLQANQTAAIHTQKGNVKAHVIAVSGSPSDETRSVDLAADGPWPDFVRPDLAINATIDIGKLDNVLWIGRPVHGSPNSGAPLFKIVADGTQAQRVYVKFGRASAQTIQVLTGLQAGDKVIISDMSAWQNFDRIHLK